MNSVDTALLEALFSVREPALTQLFLWITLLGQAWIVYALSALSILLLVYKKRVAYAVALAISVGATGVLILILKGVLLRPRPPVEFQVYVESWYSFPSAHAALAVAFYGFLAYATWRLVRRKIHRYIDVFGALSIIAAVCFSRIYLGVHYPSDVAAGILIGAFGVWLGLKYERIAGNGRT